MFLTVLHQQFVGEKNIHQIVKSPSRIHKEPHFFGHLKPEPFEKKEPELLEKKPESEKKLAGSPALPFLIKIMQSMHNCYCIVQMHVQKKILPYYLPISLVSSSTQGRCQKEGSATKIFNTIDKKNLLLWRMVILVKINDTIKLNEQ